MALVLAGATNSSAPSSRGSHHEATDARDSRHWLFVVLAKGKRYGARVHFHPRYMSPFASMTRIDGDRLADGRATVPYFGRLAIDWVHVFSIDRTNFALF